MMSKRLEFEAFPGRFRLIGPIGRMGLMMIEYNPIPAGIVCEDKKASRDRRCGVGGLKFGKAAVPSVRVCGILFPQIRESMAVAHGIRTARRAAHIACDRRQHIRIIHLLIKKLRIPYNL